MVGNPPEDEPVARPNRKSNRGFASMSPERRREIASNGGKAAHAMGKAHVFTHEEASAAGKKGGSKTAYTYAKRAALRHGGFTDEEIQERLNSLNKVIEEQGDE